MKDKKTKLNKIPKAVVNNLEDAKSAIRRTKALGAFSVKSYNQPRREQRQQVIEAARELNIMVVPEGGSFFYHNKHDVAHPDYARKQHKGAYYYGNPSHTRKQTRF